jgi:hypothetical protein
MTGTKNTLNLLARGLQERLIPINELPEEMQALLLRLALREAERLHYSAEELREVSDDDDWQLLLVEGKRV